MDVEDDGIVSRDRREARRQLLAQFNELVELVQVEVERLYFAWIELQNLDDSGGRLPPPPSQN